MARSPSAEPTKPSKRKGTRSVSTLTPSQLARKRANDREAQRAIRARTKEHIERLERELEELKSRHSRDETVQDLIKRNKALEKELTALRESLGIQTGRHYPTASYEDNLSASGSGVSSRASSFGQNSPEYSGLPNFGTQYIPTSEPCESWPSGMPYVPSVVSSPSSSIGTTDDYVTGYIPTSVPTSMMEGGVLSQPAATCLDGSKIEYDDLESEGSYSPHGPHHASPSYLQQQTWPVYPMYYPRSPAL